MFRMRLVTATAVAFVALLMTGCATMYVDNGLKEVASSEYMKPPEPKPVQLLFNFQTKGAANARATKFLAEDVQKTVAASGLFSSLSAEPVAGAKGVRDSTSWQPSLLVSFVRRVPGWQA